MAIKTFSVGEVLTASDTNTYLANSGLVYVTSTTIGTAVSSVAVTNVFSSTYDNYQITISGGTTSASAAYLLQLGSTTTEYYGSWYYDLYTGAQTGTLRRDNGANLYLGNTGGAFAGRAHSIFDIFSPNKAERTTISGKTYGAGYSGWVGGEQYSTTVFTGFTILLTTGTMTGGTITVMGYRKA
jgi:hypothetical protein